MYFQTKLGCRHLNLTALYEIFWFEICLFLGKETSFSIMFDRKRNVKRIIQGKNKIGIKMQFIIIFNVILFNFIHFLLLWGLVEWFQEVSM